ncbi:MAG: hypothetical protein HYY96_14900 [Candidatus Tectomicrobia bacterium]|nr:hypothetical protein [Candidatus Tectomicrobia bacterium]
MTNDSKGRPALFDTDKYDDYCFQYGQVRGPLALAIDHLVDCQVLLGQLDVYYRHIGDPAQGAPDIATLRQHLEIIKSLVKQTLQQAARDQA